MTVIVDASVALKWVIEEEGSQAARTLLLDEPLAAPDLLIVEMRKCPLGKSSPRGPHARSRRCSAGGNPSRPHRAIACRRLHFRRPGDGVRPRSDGLRQPLPRRSLSRAG